jgi:Leucine-rich repeat (LRR) protein
MIVIMYLKISRIPLLILMLIPSFTWAQQCRDYACVIAKVKKLMEQTPKDYKAILDNLDSAEGYPDSKAEQIRGLWRRVFVLIENEKNEAKRARDEAKKQTEIAQNERDRADNALIQANTERAKTIATLNKIYFFQGKFGLAYDENEKKYGFIDRELNTKIDFKYREALPFDYTGFAKVKMNDIYFLIDIFGKEYKLATDITQLDTSITALDFTNEKLTEIPPSVFQNTQLNVLLLSSNQLQSPQNELIKLTNLTSLDLSFNRLTKLPFEFGKLTNLTSLYLNNNQLTNLEIDLFKLNKLTSLDLSYTKLDSLPPEFGRLTNLTNLYLRWNNLTSLPPEFGKLTNLINLDLRWNNLKKLPLEFGKLTNLTSLDLRDNQFLPNEFGELPNLTILYLSNNKLTNLPSELFKLTNLTTLYLSNNKLTDLPSELFKLTNLTTLGLSNNNLINLPSEFRKLTNLIRLDLRKNPIPKEEQEKIKKLLPNCKIIF